MGLKFFRIALLALSFFVFRPFDASAQVAGDYRMNLGNFQAEVWSDRTAWERYNGATWVTPTAGQGYPGQTSTPATVTVDANFLSRVTLDVSPAFPLGTFNVTGFICIVNTSGNRNLTINTALSIALFNAMDFGGTGALSVLGTSNIAGSLTDSDNGGITTFTGLVTVSGTLTSTVVTTTANMIFKGGIANTGTVNAGGATFNTNNQAISGDGDTSFADNVLINAVTLTNSNTGNFFVGGSTTFQTSGGFTDNSNNGNTTFGGTVNIVLGTTLTTSAVTTTANLEFQGGIANAGTFTAGGATFNTNAQTVSGTNAIAFANSIAITGSVVNVTNSSNFTVTGTTTITAAGGFTDSNNTGITTFVGNVSLAAGTNFISTTVTTTANLIFRGGIANSGTVNAGGATFNTNNQALTGSGDTNFANNVLINAVTLTNSNTGDLVVTGTTTFQTSGGFTDSTNTGTETFVGLVTIPTGTNFISTASTTVGFLEFRGGIANDGTFTAGGATFTTSAGQTISGGSGLSFGNNVAITGSLVTVTNTSTFLVTGTTTLTVSGGFTDSNNGALTRFGGNVNVGVGTTFTSTAITTVTNMVFRGGIVNDGTFNGGAATFDTNAQALAGSVKITFANSVVVTGITVTNSNAASVDLTNAAAATLSGGGGWTQGANSTLNYTGTTLTVTTFTASSSQNTVNYNGTTLAVTVRSPAAATYYHLTLSGTGNITKTLAANTTVLGNLTIANTSIFSVSTFTLSVGGNWTNSSSNADPFVQGTQTVTFLTSTAAQTISNTGNALGTEFHNVVFNNSFAAIPNITISNAVVVRNSLTMTSGITNLSGTTFTLGVAATASTLVRAVSTTNNWMYNGSFKRFWVANVAISSTAGNLYGMFPLGTSTASSFRPVQINTTVTPTGAGTFTATHVDDPNTTDLAPPYNDGGTNIVRKHNAHFVTAITGGTGGTYSISATMTGLLAGTLGNIRLAIHTGVAASTTASAVGTHSGATGTAPNPTATRIGITTLTDLNNDFRISSTNTTQTPLPVELTSFAASLMNDEVVLNWRTATELNNDHFSVERGQTTEAFESIASVPGNGTSQEPHSYSAIDPTPIYGRSYYRLKQTDYDGKSTYSNVVLMDYQGPRFATLRAFPNPSTGQTVTILLIGLKDQSSVPIQVVSMRGQVIYQNVLEVETPGTLRHELQFNAPLGQGLYIIKAGETLQLSQKLIVN